jgi:hypothetical protein
MYILLVNELIILNNYTISLRGRWSKLRRRRSHSWRRSSHSWRRHHTRRKRTLHTRRHPLSGHWRSHWHSWSTDTSTRTSQARLSLLHHRWSKLNSSPHWLCFSWTRMSCSLSHSSARLRRRSFCTHCHYIFTSK